VTCPVAETVATLVFDEAQVSWPWMADPALADICTVVPTEIVTVSGEMTRGALLGVLVPPPMEANRGSVMRVSHAARDATAIPRMNTRWIRMLTGEEFIVPRLRICHGRVGSR
jgi:hypothetical protein